MRLGVRGMLPSAVDEIDVAGVRRIRAAGFTGVEWSPRFGLPDQALDQAREVGSIFASEDVAIVGLGLYGTNLIDQNEAARRSSIANLRQAFARAQALGCQSVVTGVGSLNPAGKWFAHPANYGPETRERLIDALRDVARAAEDEGVIVALEGHMNTPLKDAPTTRAVIDEVGSAALKANFDPANWITFETVFSSGTAIEAMFDTLGDRVHHAHSKGVALEDRVLIHLNEAGTGAEGDLLDHATYLRRLASLPGERYLIIEHLPVDAIPDARAHLLRVAQSVGVSFD